MAAPVTTALAVVEDAVLSALRAIGATEGNPTPTAAWWNAEVPQGTAARLALPATDASYLSRFFVAQHQDGGGQEAPLLNSRGWRGLVAVRCHSRSKTTARAGLELAAVALQTLTPPTGLTLRAAWRRPLALPADGLVFTAAGLWELEARRVP